MFFEAINAGLLQPPFYYTSAPISMNFAAIGSIISHEITHVFEKKRKTFSEKTKAMNLWRKESKQKYEQRVNCFQKQYASYTESKTGRKLNGRRTINDNIADNNGLRQCIQYSLLYIWCGNDSKKYTDDLIIWGTHSPRRFRVNVPLSNSFEFAKAFDCKIGSKMNPIDKCMIW
ncbi:peptidase family M13-like protein [Leptotrombidium deliense]|uniref:Peptidase family M13-like protein n=1 Tax=Leptotrombidium deliense TaxID=299467 RepID=A0A443S2L4_9ACAR|nr:peptidase family M13-like protein [Leptotrombidium deliense]